MQEYEANQETKRKKRESTLFPRNHDVGETSISLPPFPRWCPLGNVKHHGERLTAADSNKEAEMKKEA